jgi:uncharacterized damage-inducible protein DinB
MDERFKRLFAYDEWANREALASLKQADRPSEKSIKVMAHIVASEWLWLTRLRSEKQRFAVWPELTLAECEAQLGELSAEWTDYLEKAPLSRSVDYVNSKGEPWTSGVEDMLMHVVMHSSYHRGQIASELRSSGNTPAYTDFIHSVRQGLVT